ncbi:MAG: hypothetical protein ACLUKN_05175 [Bacilli bacterium]
MRAAAGDGFECGIHSWDHFKWQDHIFDMRKSQIEAEFNAARAEFEKILDFPPCCGALMANIPRCA